MQITKTKIITGYVVLPLLLLAFSLGALAMFVTANGESAPADYMSGRAFSTLAAKPVSLLSPYSSGDVYNEMLAVKDIFDEYNEAYPNRLSVYVAKGSAATLSKMQSYISTTERMHIASHGSWSQSTGPKIAMAGGYLTKLIVADWNLKDGLTKVIYMSACNSMGHNGIIDTTLADKLRQRTSVVSVVGFKDVANIVGATLLSQSFWGFHVTYTSTGGTSTDAAYTNTRDRIYTKIEIIKGLGSIAISAAVGLLLLLAGSGVGLALLSALLSTVTSWIVFSVLLDEILKTVNNWEIVGSSVPGLSWGSGGGGGGGSRGPIDTTH